MVNYFREAIRQALHGAAALRIFYISLFLPLHMHLLRYFSPFRIQYGINFFLSKTLQPIQLLIIIKLDYCIIIKQKIIHGWCTIFVIILLLLVTQRSLYIMLLNSRNTRACAIPLRAFQFEIAKLICGECARNISVHKRSLFPKWTSLTMSKSRQNGTDAGKAINGSHLYHVWYVSPS